MDMFTSSSDHMVILRSQNKITDFFMILAWASLFNIVNQNKYKLNELSWIST